MDIGLVIFDLDGTLADTIEDLGNAVNHALERKGYPVHGIGEYRMMVGRGIRNLVISALPCNVKSNVTLADEVLSDFVDYYSAHICDRSVPYDGMRELLRNLDRRGIGYAVASNKFQEGAQALVSRLFPDARFLAVIGNMEGRPLKPDPSVVSLCMQAAGITDRGKVLMAGDSAVDIMTASNAGIRSVGVTWGFRGEDELAGAGADFIARSADELAELLYGNGIMNKTIYK